MTEDRINEPWTRQEEHELTKLWNEGITTVQIGLRMGRRKNQVIGKAHRLGLPARPSPIKVPGYRKKKGGGNQSRAYPGA